MENADVSHTNGCSHYRRKARLVAPCCGKVYTCRFCHDDAESHQLDRCQVSQVECIACGHRQAAVQTCIHCNVRLGQYYCSICHLYDDVSRGQYHCDGCGICRVGGRDNFFHCTRCDMCLPNEMENKHKCVEKASRSNCSICMEDIHTSRARSHIPPCGHMIHRHCYEHLVKRGYYACPLCSMTMFNMDTVWDNLDAEVAQTQMPQRYRKCYARILCNDCHNTTLTRFHLLGLKCGQCGSYNTARTDGPMFRRTTKGEMVPFSESDASDVSGDEDEDVGRQQESTEVRESEQEQDAGGQQT